MCDLVSSINHVNSKNNSDSNQDPNTFIYGQLGCIYSITWTGWWWPFGLWRLDYKPNKIVKVQCHFWLLVTLIVAIRGLN